MTITYNLVSVSASTATVIASGTNTTLQFAAPNSRTSVTVSNASGHTIYLGDANVTALNGYQLATGTSVTVILYAPDVLYGLSSSGAQNVSYIQTGA